MMHVTFFLRAVLEIYRLYIYIDCKQRLYRAVKFPSYTCKKEILLVNYFTSHLIFEMHPHRCVYKQKHSCKNQNFQFGKTLLKDGILISYPLTLQHKVVCSLRAAVSGHRHCEQIAIHMLLIGLCRAPIAHCLQSQMDFPCLLLSMVISLPNSSHPYRKTC